MEVGNLKYGTFYVARWGSVKTNEGLIFLYQGDPTKTKTHFLTAYKREYRYDTCLGSDKLTNFSIREAYGDEIAMLRKHMMLEEGTKVRFEKGDYVITDSSNYISTGKVKKALRVTASKCYINNSGFWYIKDTRHATQEEILSSVYREEYISSTGHKTIKSNSNGLQSKITADRQSKRGVAVRLRRSTSKATNGVRPIGNAKRVVTRRASIRHCEISKTAISSGGIRCTS